MHECPNPYSSSGAILQDLMHVQVHSPSLPGIWELNWQRPVAYICMGPGLLSCSTKMNKEVTLIMHFFFYHFYKRQVEGQNKKILLQ